MTDIMSLQYPPPPNGTNIALQQPGYLPAEYSSIHSPTGLVQDTNMPPKGRHDPITKNLNMRLAKSLSTPASLKSAAVQQQVSLSQDQNALSLAAEKRRNKLGYHRTSVACVSLTSSVGRAFEYSNSGMPNWMSADVSPNSAKPGDLGTPWRPYPQESPTTPVFTSYTQHTTAPSATWAQHPEPAAREDMWYPTPTPRSLSFGTESVVGNHAQYPPISQMTSGLPTRPFDRKSGSMPEIYHSSINTAGTSLDTVSLSAGTEGTQSYDGWQPYSYGKPNDSSDAYVGWGGEQATSSATETHATSSNVYYTGR
ncbi:hypothetical protein CMQ_4211 [Grosmannia clavigera kw1407]|uniref:Uncharacterized protein n=1 Tax=Grosmannia clavigera (strain kw1407 / UAMH 11150) TaxID=655863 RepID=F0X937_GROCL|nr:uncharacterized protein CMQ_4211 [Grosmannia clavigera kw1407]EFX06142.1 hypothetical protein CMQ_4211 [Grosmannia clavigera kw1407]